jgi:hypothetical protein
MQDNKKSNVQTMTYKLHHCQPLMGSNISSVVAAAMSKFLWPTGH